MILRSITKHVKDQNWFAVGLDFFIVVFGVFIGLQVQQWAVELQRQSSERQYLARLHGEVELLIESRNRYDQSRPAAAALLKEAAEILMSDSDENELSTSQCRAISAASYLTVPPANLPTITELLSSGRLDQIHSTNVRNSILEYTQDASRARDLISIQATQAENLARKYPALIQTRFTDTADFHNSCDTPAMRKNGAFMNEFSINTYTYTVYVNRALLPVSRQLGALHAVLDQALSIEHDKLETNPKIGKNE